MALPAILAVVLAGAYFAYNALTDYRQNDSETRAETDTVSGTPETEEETAKNEDKFPAPDFTVYDVKGNAVKLSGFFGSPIVLNFWASWCPPCKSEMPVFDKVYTEMKDDVVFLMVDMVDGIRETVSKGSGYIETQGYSFDVYFDTLQEAAYTYRIFSIPVTLFIDRDGNIKAGHMGALDEDGLREGISKIYPD